MRRYAFRVQLIERFVQVVGTATLGALLGMLSSGAAARALGLSPVLRLALLSRSTTTALAPELCALVGTLPALGMLAAFVTGLVAIPLGVPLLDALGVRDPPTRGLALGAAAHGGAAIALNEERNAFAFAALMMSLGAAASVGLLYLPPVRGLVLRVAVGSRPL